VELGDHQQIKILLAIFNMPKTLVLNLIQITKVRINFNSYLGETKNIENIKFLRKNNTSIVSQSISKRNSLKMGSIVEVPDNASNQEANLAHASVFNGSNRSSRIFEQSNTHRIQEVNSIISGQKTLKI